MSGTRGIGNLAASIHHFLTVYVAAAFDAVDDMASLRCRLAEVLGPGIAEDDLPDEWLNELWESHAGCW